MLEPVALYRHQILDVDAAQPRGQTLTGPASTDLQPPRGGAERDAGMGATVDLVSLDPVCRAHVPGKRDLRRGVPEKPGQRPQDAIGVLAQRHLDTLAIHRVGEVESGEHGYSVVVVQPTDEHPRGACAP